MIPVRQIRMKKVKSFGLMAFFNIISDGKDNVVTAIIKLNTVPRFAPFPSNASAIGIVPKISPYIGIPTRVANITLNGFLSPRMLITNSSGMTL